MSMKHEKGNNGWVWIERRMQIESRLHKNTTHSFLKRESEREREGA